METMRSLFGILTITIAIATQVHAQTAPTNAVYDVAHDISTQANPSGVWSYGWKVSANGTFNLFANLKTTQFDNGITAYAWGIDPVPGVYWNPSTTATGTSDGGAGQYPPRTVWVYAGYGGQPQNFGVIRFTAPNQGGGVYRLESTVKCFLDGTASGDADYHVVVNGVEIFSQFLSPNSATGYTNILTLSAGDAIDFMSGRGADGVINASGLKMQITLTTPVICIPHGAKAKAVVVNGFVVGATITDGGCGYTNTPNVSFLGGGGTGATATAVVGNGAVTGITITGAGLGYSGVPNIYVDAPLGQQVGLLKAVKPLLWGLHLGSNYQLQVSVDMITWTNNGSPFAATNASMIYPQYFDVDNFNQLFFRAQGAP